MAGLTAQRHRVPSGVLPQPPRAPVADGNPAIGHIMTPRVQYTYHTPPPRTEVTGVANSSEPGLPLPYFDNTAVNPARRHSLSLPFPCL